MKPKIFQTVTDVACYWKNRGAINNKNPGPIGIYYLIFNIWLKTFATFALSFIGGATIIFGKFF